MKLLGRITTIALIALLLYGGGYWVVIKKGYTRQLLSEHFPSDPFSVPTSSHVQVWTIHRAFESIFKPAREFEFLLFVHPKVRKALIGHWSERHPYNYFILEPDLKCRFQLEDFVFDGEVEYDRAGFGFRGELQHQGQTLPFAIFPSGGIPGLTDPTEGYYVLACVAWVPGGDPFDMGDSDCFALTKKPMP